MSFELRLFIHFVIIILLTVLTQIGGIVYLFTLGLFLITGRSVEGYIKRAALRLCLFLFLYLAATFAIVPPLAKLGGRVPLPVFEKQNLKPLTGLTCLLNRHYVNPVLRNATFKAVERVNKQYPGTVVNYLDANFPFYNGFPLIPHISHNDGKKLDLAFLYKNKNGEITTDHPSWIGYGVCEEPKPDEQNSPYLCSRKGYWQYSLMAEIISQEEKQHYIFDGERTKGLIEEIVREAQIEKVFIEPHLKDRLKLTSSKIRFHGCQAVRHDDHIHIQL